jgi:hypothetical protein
MGASGPGLIREAGSGRQVPSEKSRAKDRDRNAAFPGPLVFSKTRRISTMPRYFFHVREADGDIGRDLEGQTLPDLEAARREAASAIREMLGEWMLHGGGQHPQQIEIADENGALVATLNTADVLFRDGEFRRYSDDVTKSAPTGLARSRGRKDIAE